MTDSLTLDYMGLRLDIDFEVELTDDDQIDEFQIEDIRFNGESLFEFFQSMYTKRVLFIAPGSPTVYDSCLDVIKDLAEAKFLTDLEPKSVREYNESGE